MFEARLNATAEDALRPENGLPEPDELAPSQRRHLRSRQSADSGAERQTALSVFTEQDIDLTFSRRLQGDPESPKRGGGLWPVVTLIGIFVGLVVPLAGEVYPPVAAGAEAASQMEEGGLVESRRLASTRPGSTSLDLCPRCSSPTHWLSGCCSGGWGETNAEAWLRVPEVCTRSI